jgi:t-SNARE complex subunit (syntaxin)
MRAFARYRSLLKENEELKIEIKKLDKKVNSIFQLLLARIDALHEKKKQPRERIGFKPDKI